MAEVSKRSLIYLFEPFSHITKLHVNFSPQIRVCMNKRCNILEVI